jgi:uncharacterized Ntn-hydrolase superfamily protein
MGLFDSLGGGYPMLLGPMNLDTKVNLEPMVLGAQMRMNTNSALQTRAAADKKANAIHLEGFDEKIKALPGEGENLRENLKMQEQAVRSAYDRSGGDIKNTEVIKAVNSYGNTFYATKMASQNLDEHTSGLKTIQETGISSQARIDPATGFPLTYLDKTGSLRAIKEQEYFLNQEGYQPRTQDGKPIVGEKRDFGVQKGSTKDVTETLSKYFTGLGYTSTADAGLAYEKKTGIPKETFIQGKTDGFDILYKYDAHEKDNIIQIQAAADAFLGSVSGEVKAGLWREYLDKTNNVLVGKDDKEITTNFNIYVADRVKDFAGKEIVIDRAYKEDPMLQKTDRTASGGPDDPALKMNIYGLANLLNPVVFNRSSMEQDYTDPAVGHEYVTNVSDGDDDDEKLRTVKSYVPIDENTGQVMKPGVVPNEDPVTQGMRSLITGAKNAGDIGSDQWSAFMNASPTSAYALAAKGGTVFTIPELQRAGFKIADVGTELKPMFSPGLKNGVPSDAVQYKTKSVPVIGADGKKTYRETIDSKSHPVKVYRRLTLIADETTLDNAELKSLHKDPESQLWKKYETSDAGFWDLTEDPTNEDIQMGIRPTADGNNVTMDVWVEMNPNDAVNPALAGSKENYEAAIQQRNYENYLQAAKKNIKK